jgi:hypothetical protein
MLTRNLYELDEVVAALQLCLRTVNQQAYFWAWELYISEENLRVLQESWLAHGAPHDPKIFKNLILTPDTVITTCSRVLAAIAKKNKLVPPEILPMTQKTGRKARLYAIPVEALHAKTTRGSMMYKYTNIQDLREPILLLPTACAFWRRVTAEAGFKVDGDTVEVPDDEAYEAFYDKYFPDDIPDEWSLADQHKSHGRGLINLPPSCGPLPSGGP